MTAVSGPAAVRLLAEVDADKVRAMAKEASSDGASGVDEAEALSDCFQAYVASELGENNTIRVKALRQALDL